ATDAISPGFTSATSWPSTFGLNMPTDAVSFSSSTVTVRPGGRAAVTVSIAPDPTLSTGSMYDGFITLSPQDGSTDITVPYAGMTGDYQSLQVLTPTANKLPVLAQLNAAGTTFSLIRTASQTFTLQGN